MPVWAIGLIVIGVLVLARKQTPVKPGETPPTPDFGGRTGGNMVATLHPSGQTTIDIAKSGSWPGNLHPVVNPNGTTIWVDDFGNVIADPGVGGPGGGGIGGPRTIYIKSPTGISIDRLT